MKRLIAGLFGLLLPLPVMAAQDAKTVPPGTPVTITVTPGTAPTPTVTWNILDRHGHVTPHRCGCNHTGGGNIDVSSPTADTVVITMGGICVATGHPCHASEAGMDFDLEQCLEVVFDPKVKKAKLTIEGRVIGLLRSHCKGAGSAQEGPGCATLTAGPAQIVTVCTPDHSVAGGENLSINDHCGPLEVPVTAGKYTLHQTFHICATHGKYLLPCKAASAEFAPDPALDPLWISYWEPFHGAIKKDFGFQITLKLTEDTSNGEKKEEEKKEEKKEEEKKPEEIKKPEEKKPEEKKPEEKKPEAETPEVLPQ